MMRLRRNAEAVSEDSKSDKVVTKEEGPERMCGECLDFDVCQPKVKGLEEGTFVGKCFKFKDELNMSKSAEVSTQSTCYTCTKKSDPSCLVYMGESCTGYVDARAEDVEPPEAPICHTCTKLNKGPCEPLVDNICKDYRDAMPKSVGPEPSVREHNVGDSDYSKHDIQPWSIWLEYDLNPWDADVVKRILRTKKIRGKSKKAARIEDYEKIIHVCQERIRQLNV